VEVKEYIDRQPDAEISRDVPRSRAVAVVNAATSTPLCKVTRVIAGPLPGGNVELLLSAAGIVYTSPVADPSKAQILATWEKVPCNFDQKAAKIGRRGTYAASFTVKCRCGKLASGKCKPDTKGCK
jgi:hypothetical protein